MEKHRMRPLYKELAGAIHARHACAQKPVNEFGLEIHTHTIQVCEDLLPSGSGWDSGTKIDVPNSHADKIVLYGSYHHMNEGGYYDGYTDHTIIVKPSLTCDFNLRITGTNRSDIKEYLHQIFDADLRQDIAYWLYLERFPQFKVTSKWEFSCPFCLTEWSGDAHVIHTCDAFPGDKTNPNRYQGKNERQIFFVQSDPAKTFKTANEAQSFAADLMEQEFYKGGK